MNLRETIRIENAGLYPAATVDQLRTALSNGAALQPNAARRNFYDLDTEGRTYFIYVALIATWDRKRHPKTPRWMVRPRGGDESRYTSSLSSDDRPGYFVGHLLIPG